MQSKSEIPPLSSGYEEGWVLNVHAIDTRGADDNMGCTECRCDVYGFSVARDEAPGGLHCCPNDSRWRLKQGFHGENKTIYLRCTVDQSKGIGATHHCKVEYGVESCVAVVEKDGCVDMKSASFSFPLWWRCGVWGWTSTCRGCRHHTIWQGGKTICLSKPIYGKENEARNEAGFIVGMSTCYPTPAAPDKISAEETLTLVSNYSSVESHTGVMVLFYLLIAHSHPKPLPTLIGHLLLYLGCNLYASKFMMVPKIVWPIILVGVVIIATVVALKGRIGNSKGYEAIP
ncbi:hypothetical protein AAHA92_14661 [Salvia divinorum]|uniref:Uncharacterized protein n=1 Tax=Salvia divinorum TaxID=28513 RepID=A0ABD1HCC8_SALDI